MVSGLGNHVMSFYWFRHIELHSSKWTCSACRTAVSLVHTELCAMKADCVCWPLSEWSVFSDAHVAALVFNRSFCPKWRKFAKSFNMLDTLTISVMRNRNLVLSCLAQTIESFTNQALVLRIEKENNRSGEAGKPSKATWLILPVVICLSQRLSHACLCTSRKWWSREWLITTALVYWIWLSTWITVVILELIHAFKLRPFGRSAFIRTKPIGFGRYLVNLNNSADRTVFVLATNLSSVCLINFRW